LRIRTHPTLAVTSQNKMRYAVRSQVSYANARMQTTFFNTHDAEWLGINQEAASVLVTKMGKHDIPVARRGTLGWANVDFNVVEEFLASYKFHPDHADLDSGRILAWLSRRRESGNPVAWNVVVVGRESRKALKWKGLDVDLGTIVLGGEEFNAISRTRLVGPAYPANIGALVSKVDWSIDLPAIDSKKSAREVDAERARLAPGTALLVVYPISERSVPLKPGAATRQPLEAVGPVIGVGLVMPAQADGVLDDLVEAEYVSVYLSSEDDRTEEYEEQLLRGDLDDEADAHVELRGDA
jgi:hypothetical protein